MAKTTIIELCKINVEIKKFCAHIALHVSFKLFEVLP